MPDAEDVAAWAGGSVGELDALAARMAEAAPVLTRQQPKRRGGYREILDPLIELKLVTRNLLLALTQNLPYVPPPHVHGFVRGRSTITNASAHLDRACVLRIDLADFFPSIRTERVAAALAELGLDPDATGLCTRLTTVHGRLPIGLPTSPYLSNVVFAPTDAKLAAYAERHDLAFTRYADDLTFSGEAVDDRHLNGIRGALMAEGWTVNDRKVRFMRRGGPQYVTGLYVGRPDRPRIPRRIKRQMRTVTHRIETLGYATYLKDFDGRAAGMFPNRLLGWARYITAVEPAVGKPLLRRLSDSIDDAYFDLEDYFGEEGLWDDPW